jgi:uncharacterized protein YndB with AHSA1/START domain
MPIIKVEQFVEAPVAEAYRAFTNSTALREWLCDYATMTPHVGGRIYLWWNGDFYSSGSFTAIDPNRLAAFTWFSRIDPGPSQITIKFTKKRGGTLIKLAHKIPGGAKWKHAPESFKNQWTGSLENLASVLGTGIDLRIANRPMLGININDFSAEIAEKLGVPVSEGIRLSEVLEGMGAQKAGLQKDDVIVEVNGKTMTNQFDTFLQAIQGKKGGDKIDVTFYRGAEKKTVTMELSKRPMPEAIFDAKQLADKMRANRQPVLDELIKVFEGVTEAQASAKPAPGEWSAKEVLAHLIANERFVLSHYDQIVTGYEPQTDGFGDPNPNANTAMIKTFGSYRAMLDEFIRLNEEFFHFIALLPKSFAAHKGSFYRISYEVLIPPLHLVDHIGQLKNALGK